MKNILITSDYLKNLKTSLQENLANLKGEKWAVKLHMGEYGNLNYVRPSIAATVAEVLINKGAKPFLFDTTTRYNYRRFTVKDYLETARINGFTKETMGCPVVVSNNAVYVKSKNLGQVGVAREIYESDGMIVLSHFKGHICTGFGGAIKNLGMGAVDSITKTAIHEMAKPVIDDKKCVGCQTCEQVCPVGVIKVNNQRKARIDYGLCAGCDTCVVNCPHQALRIKTSFSSLLAEAAAVVLSRFKKGKVLYINIMFDISRFCDCRGDRNEIVAPDCGIMIGDNIVLVDKESFKLVEKASNGKFSQMYKIDYLEQVKEIRKFLKTS